MKIKVRTSSGIAYKAVVDKNTIDEVADYIATHDWIKSDDGCVIMTRNIDMVKAD